MPNEKRSQNNDEDVSVFKTKDLQYILDVNSKAVEIYLEVEKQNEQIIEILNEFKSASSGHDNQLTGLTKDNENINDRIKDLVIICSDLKDSCNSLNNNLNSLVKKIDEDIKPKIAETDKNMFRLLIAIGALGSGTIATIYSMFHK